MKQTRIAIIGAGNMGGALIGGLVQSGHRNDSIWAIDKDLAKLKQLKTAYGINTSDNAKSIIAGAEVIVLAVKPQIIKNVVTELRTSVDLNHPPLIVSIAAGVTTRVIQQLFGDLTKISLIRAMPNIAALIGCGATALFANPHVTANERSLAESILRAVGTVVWVDDERLMDTVTALSGSGPAYFFVIMQALEKAATELGLLQEAAHMLTIETALGAAKMAAESNASFETLAKNVTSPGGTTERALAVLAHDNQLYNLLLNALKAAKLRSEELAGD